jgi:hypothetical protein
MARDAFRIPRLPRWYCSKVINHWGYLREVRSVDEDQAEYVCQACGWRGVRKRPSKKLKWHWF